MKDKINGRTLEEIKKELERFDAVAYIKQLICERDQYKRELDAAVRDLEANKRCETCMYYTPGYFCLGCRNGSDWQWRGVEGVRK